MGIQNLSSPQRAVVVPGQYLGYSLQASRLLDHLLRGSQGMAVSLEVVGDTAVTDADGAMLVEELKSRTTADNPIADRAIDFWKTIRNWVDGVVAGTFVPETTRFRLYVTRPFSGELAHQFASARSEEDVRAVIAEARARLCEGTNRVTPTSALGEHLTRIFGNQEALVAVVTNFDLEFGSGRAWDDLLRTLDATFVPPDCAEHVLYGLSGWVNTQVAACIERGEPATIAWTAFRNVVLTLVRRMDREGMLASVAGQPRQDELERELQFRTYVRQLDLIALDHDDKICAITDFLKAEVDRVEWARQGRVLQDGYDVFEAELHGAWKNHQRRCEIAHNTRTPIERGQLLYSDCFAHRTKLEQSELPDHFCRGSFHKLADAIALGWHPSFQELLSAKEEPDGDNSK